MRRKVLIAVAAVAVVGLFLWSQQPRRAPEHEQSQTVATSDAAANAGSEREAPDALEAPPPMALPSDVGEDAASASDARDTRAGRTAYPSFLPPEAIATLRTIEGGGPYPYRQDGSVFQNRERKLPSQPRGYYREYTVKTPGSRDRGARRIVAGGRPPTEFFYTDDHYRSFRRFTLDGREPVR